MPSRQQDKPAEYPYLSYQIPGADKYGYRPA